MQLQRRRQIHTRILLIGLTSDRNDVKNVEWCDNKVQRKNQGRVWKPKSKNVGEAARHKGLIRHVSRSVSQRWCRHTRSETWTDKAEVTFCLIPEMPVCPYLLYLCVCVVVQHSLRCVRMLLCPLLNRRCVHSAGIPCSMWQLAALTVNFGCMCCWMQRCWQSLCFPCCR